MAPVSCFSSRPRAATVATVEADQSWPHLPRYQTLPPLREQAEIQNGWLKERRENIPNILRKYGVDAWLVRLLRHSVVSAPRVNG